MTGTKTTYSTERELAVARSLQQVLDSWAKYIEQRETFRKEFGASPSMPSVIRELFPESVGPVPVTAKRRSSRRRIARLVRVVRKPGRKPNVQFYAEILADKGPLHTTDIANEAVSRGVIFKGKGKRPAAFLVRDALNKSTTRFVNFGANIWGLVGQQLSAPSNGHKAEQPVPTPSGHEGSRQSPMPIP